MEKIEVVIGQQGMTLRAGEEEIELGGGGAEGHALDIIAFARSHEAEVVVIAGAASERLVEALQGVGLTIEQEDASE